jgi:hypothetical protein
MAKRKPTAWNLHVTKIRKENPKLSFKKILQKAKSSYKKK